METKFETLRNFLKRSHDRLFLAYSHFQIWEALKESIAPNISGKEKADENIKTMNRYNSFFLLTIDAHRKVFALELAKFFDLNNDSLSIRKIINYSRSNKNYLKVEDFKSYNSDRDFLDNLATDYQGIQESDLDDCQTWLKEIGLNITEKESSKRIIKKSKLFKLKKFRDQALAHDQLKKENNVLNVEEIQSLFDCAEKILNRISSKLNHETWWHFGSDNNKQHTNLVIDHLTRFEPYRLQEIKNDRNAKLEKYRNSNSK